MKYTKMRTARAKPAHCLLLKLRVINTTLTRKKLLYKTTALRTKCLSILVLKTTRDSWALKQRCRK